MRMCDVGSCKLISSYRYTIIVICLCIISALISDAFLSPFGEVDVRREPFFVLAGK